MSVAQSLQCVAGVKPNHPTSLLGRIGRTLLIDIIFSNIVGTLLKLVLSLAAVERHKVTLFIYSVSMTQLGGENEALCTKML